MKFTLVLLTFLILGSTTSLIAHSFIDPVLLTQLPADDAWFQGDISRVYRNMTSGNSNHYRAKVHPLFSISTLPVVAGLARLGVDRMMSCLGLMALMAGIWTGALFIMCRTLTGHLGQASLFTLIGWASSASLFWLAIPETYAWGSLGIILALTLIALTEYRPIKEGWYVLVSAFTLGYTITNWMAGLGVAWVGLGLKRAIQVGVNGFFLVSMGWGIQKYFIPSTGFILDVKEEFAYLNPGGPFQVLGSFFFHTLIAPAVQVTRNPLGQGPLILAFQPSWPGSGGGWGILATLAWMGLLGLGVWGAFKPGLGRFKMALGLILAGQLGLHVVYGEETFLYSLHFLPLLIGLATLAPWVRVTWALGGILVISLALNNWTQFIKASSLARAAVMGMMSPWN
jgi:hypothetical protein